MIILYLGFKGFSVNEPAELIYSGTDAEAGLKAVQSSAGQYVRIGKLVNPLMIKVPLPDAPPNATPTEPKRSKK